MPKDKRIICELSENKAVKITDDVNNCHESEIFFCDNKTNLIFAKVHGFIDTVVKFAENDGLELRTPRGFVLDNIFSFDLKNKEIPEDDTQSKYLSLNRVVTLAKKMNIGVSQIGCDLYGFCDVRKANAVESCYAQIFTNIIRMDRLHRLSNVDFYNLGFNAQYASKAVYDCITNLEKLSFGNLSYRLEHLYCRLSKNERKRHHLFLINDSIHSVVADMILSVRAYLGGWLQRHEYRMLDYSVRSSIVEMNQISATVEKAMHIIDRELNFEMPEMLPWPPAVL